LMTREVIDTLPRRWLPEGMTVAYDRTLRVVMWWDAFLSVALAAVCMVASPVVAVLGLPPGALFGLGVTALVLCGLLAAFGAITGVILMLRMRAGQYLLPTRLHLPLPPGMDPTRGTP
jgi:hypothetical protein